MKKFIVSFILAASFLTAINAEDPLWMRYPTISPDGKNIAFCYQGDIYMVATEGGQAQQLTRHQAYDFQPVWSHDGNFIAFASDRHGNFDVFKLEISSGATTRLTYHSSRDYPWSFSSSDSHVLFSSTRLDSVTNAAFPSRALSELYQVPTSGGRVGQVLTTAAEMAQFNSDNTKLLYQDRKGVENKWRKHHQSSVARNIWLYDATTKKHTQITTFKGEDRNPIWNDDDSFFYLCEESGSLNIWKHSFKDMKATQVTNFEKHPIRFLSRSVDGLLCFGYSGEIYILQEGQNPIKVKVSIYGGPSKNDKETLNVRGGITEMVVSPNGKEIAFVHRGEIFVTSAKYSTTKQITKSFEQERSISFSPDGRSIVYACERNNSWSLYESSIKRKDEKYFYAATIIEEKPVLTSQVETFQPSYSPDGKEIAYLEERTTLKVYNIKEKYSRKILDGKQNYSYADGDQWYQWSPDGKWFLVAFLGKNRWMDEVGLIAADGKSEVINLTQSGYSDYAPKWSMKGKAITWFSDRHGMRSHGSWGSQDDVYAMIFDQETFDFLKRSKEDQELYDELQKESKKKESKDKKDKKDKKEEILKIDLDGIEDRKMRLTMHSSDLADAVLSPDGTTLYYLAKFEKGYNLWMHKVLDYQTRLLTKLNANSAGMEMNASGSELHVLADGRMYKITTASGQLTPISFSAKMEVNHSKERAHLFEHIWRQVKKKFYVKDLHGVDWEFYKKEYEKFLPHINNKHDLAEMFSEILGELNASHTGSGYFYRAPNGESTSSLGLFYDDSHEGAGLKIAEVMDKSPLKKASSKIKAGMIIEKINGNEIKSNDNYYKYLNGQVGKRVLVSLYDPKKNERWEETVRPTSTRGEGELTYQRWVKQRRALTEKLSQGKLGYVHIRGMNDASYREIYSEILGRHNDKLAIVVDTRFNGGGWLHDDLVTLLSGKKYFTFYPRKQDNMGGEPIFKWSKPSIVVMSEGNYSDAHLFPLAYKTLNIGRLVGMPVAGTGTAVWWETLLGGDMYFGIPQVGMLDLQGQYLENSELQPDVLVDNHPDEVAKGRDQQLEKAIEELLKEVE
ncbi:S41 family peptidase [Candidatus Uabimicrobium sp. HlEnr_7]|uniref:S41 family peptidase n=1 Tax=Candidatus Uabimicrobium helgolandensis TaxID=3095367 RepID=UPI0035562CD7